RRVHPPERITQEVKLPARNPTDPCLLLINCQLQLAHDLAQMMQCVLRAAPSAQDHKVIRIIDEASAKALLKAELFPPQHNRRMYRFASSGERGEPCGMPRRLSRACVVRVVRPRWSVSSTGHSSHILIRCSTRRSTIRRATDFRRSACGMLPKERATDYPSPGFPRYDNDHPRGPSF